MKLSNKFYDFAKYVALIVLPASGTLYYALSGIWGLPNAEAVVGTIVAVDTFLGVLLKISTYSYENQENSYDGKINVFENQATGIKTFSLDLHYNPDDLVKKDRVVFSVNPAILSDDPNTP